jgi:hypothetical protein
MKTFAAAPARSHTLPRASRATHSKTPLTSSFSEKVQITFATELANAGMSLQALMALLGHVTPQMTLRYATLASPTLRTAYDEAMGKMRRQFTLTPVGKPILPDKVGWLHSEMLKTRVAHGYCARHQPPAPAHMPTSAKPATTTSPHPNSGMPSPTNSPTSRPSKPTPRPAAGPTKLPATTMSRTLSLTTFTASTAEVRSATD